MSSQRELVYTIKLEPEGGAEVVEATDELLEHNQAVLKNNEGLEAFQAGLINVNELTEQARSKFRQNVEAVKSVTTETQRMSEAERHLEQILSEANAALQENSFFLEATKLEYEEGSLSQEQYIQRLQELKQQVEGIDAPSINLIRRQREINRELNRMNPAIQTGTRQLGTANTAMFTMTSALTRLNPMLGSGVSQVMSLTRGMGQLSAQTGGVDTAFASLTRFALSPAGIISVLALTASGVALLISRYSDLEQKTLDLDKVSKGYLETSDNIIRALNELRDIEQGLFSTAGLQNRLQNQERILSIEEERLSSLKEQRGVLVEQLSGGRMQIDVVEQHGRVLNDIKETEKVIEETNKRILDLKSQIRGLDRAAGDPETVRAELDRILLDATQDLDKLLDDDFDISLAISDDLRNLEELIQGEQDLTGEIEKQNQQRLRDRVNSLNQMVRFEDQIETMRINAVRASGDEIRALEMERDRQLRELAENEDISDRQRLEARELIIEEFANRELAIKTALAEEEKRLAEEIAELERQRLLERRQNQELAIFATLDLLGVAFESSKKLSQGIAIMDGLAASISALKNPPGPPWTIPLSASILALSISRANQIGNTRMGSRASGGGQSNPILNFRGVSADTTPGRESMQLSGTLKLKDRSGKMLTEMELDRDASGDTAYISEV